MDVSDRQFHYKGDEWRWPAIPGIVEVKILENDWKMARVWAEKHEKFPGFKDRSITRCEGLLAGMVGEIVFLRYSGALVSHGTNHDLILNNKAYEVKTKRVNVCRVESHYTATIPAYLRGVQTPQFWIHTRVNEKMNLCFLMGYISDKRFWKEATFYKKGEFEPGTYFLFKEDTYCVAQRDLSDIRHLKSHWFNLRKEQQGEFLLGYLGHLDERMSDEEVEWLLKLV